MSDSINLANLHQEYSSLMAVVHKKIRVFEAVLASSGEGENIISDSQCNTMVRDVVELLDRGQSVRKQLLHLDTNLLNPIDLNYCSNAINALNIQTERLLMLFDDLNAIKKGCPSKVNVMRNFPGRP